MLFKIYFRCACNAVLCDLCYKFLLSLQIGITPPSFATDGSSLLVIPGFGFEQIVPSKIYLSPVSSPALKQLLLRQGQYELHSLVLVYHVLSWVLKIDWGLGLNDVQAWGYYSDCIRWKSSCIQHSDKKATLPGKFRGLLRLKNLSKIEMLSQNFSSSASECWCLNVVWRQKICANLCLLQFTHCSQLFTWPFNLNLELLYKPLKGELLFLVHLYLGFLLDVQVQVDIHPKSCLLFLQDLHVLLS